jgi:hypothetical protein
MTLQRKEKLHLIIIYNREKQNPKIIFTNFILIENQLDRVKFPGEVPILNARHRSDTY